MSLNFLRRQPQPPTPPRVIYTAPSGAAYWADVIEFKPEDGVNWVKLVVYYRYDEAKRVWHTMDKWTTFETIQPEKQVA
jgi:hypothetical protein